MTLLRRIRNLFSWAILLWPALLLASPSSAARAYKAHDFETALKEYQRLLQKNASDPRLHFNAGAAAYSARLFHEATKQFTAALESTDVQMQQKAYYNRGDARYRLGEASETPKNKTEAWEQAIKDFELSLKLNPQDQNARFNLDFVKRRLEELKKEQESKGSDSDQGEADAAQAARKAAKAAADEKVKNRQYAEAVQIMEEIGKKDPKVEEEYGPFIQRLKEIINVESGKQ